MFNCSLAREVPRRFAQSARRSLSTKQLNINPTIFNLPASGIREIMSKGAELDLKFPTNPVIRLEVGQPNFDTPKHVIDATVSALQRGQTTYSPNNGVSELREAIAGKYNRAGYPTDISQIVVTVGSSLSLYSLLLTLLAPGDDCLLPLPGFPNYNAALAMLGATSVPYLCPPNSGYLPTIETLERAVTPNTRCIVVCNPGNPTGASYPKQLLHDVIAWAHARDIFVLSDEIYEEIVFDAPHATAAMFENDSDIDPSKIAIVSGVSKGYAMTGFRVGWTRTSPFVAAQMTKIQEPLVSCATAFSQTAAAAALNGPQQCVGDMLSQYKKRRDLAMSILKARGRPSAYTPGGAFYLPVDVSTSGMSSRDFALKLLSDKHCAVAPGIAFNTSEGPPSGDNLAILDSFVRVSLANSDENVGKGMHLLCDMLDELEAKA